MRLKELARLGFHPSVLRYPYRVKTKNGKVKLVHDPSKGLGKLSEAPIGSRGDVSEILQAVALFLLFRDQSVTAEGIIADYNFLFLLHCKTHYLILKTIKQEDCMLACQTK